MVAFAPTGERSDPLGKDANIVAASEKAAKFRSFKQLGTAQRLLIKSEAKSKSGNVHRTRLCYGVRAYQAESISVKVPSDTSKESASLSGLQTCGSVWACPVCAKRIATQRGKEISYAIDRMTASGFVPVMMTRTASHSKEMPLKWLKNQMKRAHRYFVQSRRWRSLKAMFEIVHSIKATEITWGIENGWHPHDHTIFFIKADALKRADETALKDWVNMVTDLWLDSLSRFGLSGSRERALNVKADGDVKKDYLAKLGLEDETANLDYELSGGHNKKKGASIWTILERASHGSEGHAALYIEYVEAMTGDNWITWSHGLKELVGLDEMSDEEAAAADDEEIFSQETLVEMTDEEYLPIRKMQLYGELLELAARTRSKEVIQEWLREMATEWNNTGASKERDRLMAQYTALSARWENWRQSLNKSQNWPTDMTAFNQLYADVQDLKKRLDIR